MNKEELDNIMNCKCLQSIIENDKESHNYSQTRYKGDSTFKETPIDKSELSFNCTTSFKKEVVNTHGETIINRIEKGSKNIPLFYCPICSTKTKHTITQDSFYYQFQNE